jgi:hypothetical protein
MKKHHVVATIGTLALLANFLVPGLAFGDPIPANQTGTLQVNCPSIGGGLTWLSPPIDVGFKDVTSSGTFAQDSTDKLVVSDTQVPSSNLISISDARSGGVDNCPIDSEGASSLGFTLTVQGTGLLGQGTASDDEISADSIFLVTTTSISGGLGAYTNHNAANTVLSSEASGIGNVLENITAAYNLATGFLGTAPDEAAEYAVHGAVMSGLPKTILASSTAMNSQIAVGTALGISKGIAINQYPGNYVGTITYTLNAR